MPSPSSFIFDLEAVTGRTTDLILARSESKDYAGGDFVHIEGRGAGRGSTERRIEDAVVDVGGPTLICKSAGDALKLLPIPHSNGFSLEYKVEPLAREGD